MKTIQHTIGGELRTLDFTRSGLMDHISEATGKDAFEFFDQFKPDEKGELFIPKDAITILVYAGINSALDVAEKPNVELYRVKQWMRAVPSSDLKNLFDAILDGISDSEGKEESQQKKGSESVGVN